jgi:hypothetical protein
MQPRESLSDDLIRGLYYKHRIVEPNATTICYLEFARELLAAHDALASAPAAEPSKGIDPMQDPLRPGYFMNYAENETEAEQVLRQLACWLGAGGYNAPTVDAKVFHQKIVWGVENLLAEHKTAAQVSDPQAQVVVAVDGDLSDGQYAELASEAGAVRTPLIDDVAPPVFPTWGSWGRFCNELRRREAPDMSLTADQEQRIAAFATSKTGWDGANGGQPLDQESLALLRATGPALRLADAVVFMTHEGHLALQWRLDGGVVEAEFVPGHASWEDFLAEAERKKKTKPLADAAEFLPSEQASRTSSGWLNSVNCDEAQAAKDGGRKP